jgi:3-hydroxyisobutyrate dehydrogenase
MTTVSVSLVPRLLEAATTHSIRYLAAPVSQGVDNARLGKLSVFVGGTVEDVDACRPLLDAVAT